MALDQVEQKTDEAIEAEGNDTEVSFLETATWRSVVTLWNCGDFFTYLYIFGYH